jgi:hypothetical protein
MRVRHLCLTSLLYLSVACQPKAPPPSVTSPPSATSDLVGRTPFPELRATVTPPVGWRPDKLITAPDNTHQVWQSPTGDTAYGVIHFGLPLPVPASWVYPDFVANMKKQEGEATIVAPMQKDDALPGVRFTVDSGDYRMRINLITRGFQGWAVYAGTLRAKPERPDEVRLAEKARDQTAVGAVR